MFKQYSCKYIELYTVESWFPKQNGVVFTSEYKGFHRLCIYIKLRETSRIQLEWKLQNRCKKSEYSAIYKNGRRSDKNWLVFFLTNVYAL